MPLREGRQNSRIRYAVASSFLLTPLREGRPACPTSTTPPAVYFYSRPCGRGDMLCPATFLGAASISTHAPAGGATLRGGACPPPPRVFLLTPLREGRPACRTSTTPPVAYFYSRPCGRGDQVDQQGKQRNQISTHAPAGGATVESIDEEFARHFYSRPCGRGDFVGLQLVNVDHFISTHAPAGGATSVYTQRPPYADFISTHAPAGGATERMLAENKEDKFLLTPLREGRPRH